VVPVGAGVVEAAVVPVGAGVVEAAVVPVGTGVVEGAAGTGEAGGPDELSAVLPEAGVSDGGAPWGGPAGACGVRCSRSS